jgi:hypothetical protein
MEDDEAGCEKITPDLDPRLIRNAQTALKRCEKYVCRVRAAHPQNW